MYTDYDEGLGYIQLLRRNGIQKDTFRIYKSNDLWYHDNFISQSCNSSSIKSNTTPQINVLSNAATFELWHQRLGHPGSRTMENIHKYVNGVPKLRGNAFWKCPSCISSKIQKRAVSKKPNKNSIHKSNSVNVNSLNLQQHKKNYTIGQHWGMDFGFMRGSSYKKKTETGSTITSIDGYNSYLLIIEKSSRFIWIFLTSSKHPPIQAAKSVLEKFKSDVKHRTVRTDQGGELAKSKDFQNMIAECGFTLETTGSDASAQNGIAENPNKSLARMVRCLLYSAELPPEYWSFALIHACYIKNRLPHYTIGSTTYQAFTGTVPNLSQLRIFGSLIYGRKPGHRPAKLDQHDVLGRFLGYTATEKNVRFQDLHSKTIKTATHVIYDEAHMSVPASQAPIAAQTLQRLGYAFKESSINSNTVSVVLTSKEAKLY